MASERYVVMGLATSRSPWFSDVGRWATTAAIPVEFIRCLSVDELHARIDTGRQVSAVLLGEGTPGVDRDVLDHVSATGALVVSVGKAPPTNWPPGIGAAWLPATFDRQQLLDVLAVHALAVHRADEAALSDRPLVVNPWRGRLIAVTGAGGTGASTIAMATAQAYGADARNFGLVALADLALDADQAMMHDSRTLVPGLQEAVEAHRGADIAPDDVRELLHRVDGRGYDLLLGLRNHHDWTALRPRAVAAAIDGLLVAYRIVVADIDADVEGQDRTGSADIEDRNQLARATLRRADIALVVGHPGLAGVHQLCRTIRRIVESGFDSGRIIPVVNQLRGGMRARSEIARSIAHLLGSETALASPIFIHENKRIDDALLDGRGLPATLGSAPATAAWTLLEHRGTVSTTASEPEPVTVAPGSLGSFLDDGEFG